MKEELKKLIQIKYIQIVMKYSIIIIRNLQILVTNLTFKILYLFRVNIMTLIKFHNKMKLNQIIEETHLIVVMVNIEKKIIKHYLKKIRNTMMD